MFINGGIQAGNNAIKDPSLFSSKAKSTKISNKTDNTKPALLRVPPHSVSSGKVTREIPVEYINKLEQMTYENDPVFTEACNTWEVLPEVALPFYKSLEDLLGFGKIRQVNNELAEYLESPEVSDLREVKVAELLNERLPEWEKRELEGINHEISSLNRREEKIAHNITRGLTREERGFGSFLDNTKKKYPLGYGSLWDYEHSLPLIMEFLRSTEENKTQKTTSEPEQLPNIEGLNIGKPEENTLREILAECKKMLETYKNRLKEETEKIKVERERLNKELLEFNSTEKIDERKKEIENRFTGDSLRKVIYEIKKNWARLNYPNDIDTDGFLCFKPNLLESYIGGIYSASIGDKPFLTEDLSPTKIVLTNPKQPKDVELFRAIGGVAQVDEITGDLILTRSGEESYKAGKPDGWLDPNGLFESIKYLDAHEAKREAPKARWDKITNPQAPALKVIERRDNGDKDTYYLISGQQSEAGQDITLVLCEGGGFQTLYFGENNLPSFSTVRKPVLSFRKFKPNTEISVEVIDFAGEYEVIYPQTPIIEANNSLIWTVKTLENNLIETNNKKYPYLFWDGKLQHKFDMTKAHCIRRGEVIDYLERECEKFGFDETLTTDFVTFWAPYLMRREYVLVRFLSAEECKKVAKVNINSTETIQLIRAYLVYKPLEEQISLSEPELEYPVFDNSQPTIFDWGGFEHY